MAGAKPRKSDRVSIRLPLQVSGSDVTGRPFLEEGRTIMVSRHGARIKMARSLAPEQEVLVRCLQTGREAAARVVGLIGGGPAISVYGIALLDPDADPWGIEFPDLAEGEDAYGRVLLECVHCHTRKIAYLDAAELEVLEANRSLTQYCGRCTATSIWKRSFAEAPGPELPVPEPPPPPPPVQAKEKRSERRRPLKVRACIYSKDFGEHIVRTRDVSRNGLSFESQKLYGNNWNVQVAVPYDPRGGNIFLSARIVRVQHTSEDLKLYGVAYSHKIAEGKEL